MRTDNLIQQNSEILLWKSSLLWEDTGLAFTAEHAWSEGLV